jgi:hypothetical protein
MSIYNPKIRRRRIIVVFSCGLLIIISLITFQQQIPTIAQIALTPKNYEKEYISALRHVVDVIPQNETLAATENYPQVEYFTDREVIVPWVKSERALVQFMWKNNCSYLLVPEDAREPKPYDTPLMIQLAKKPFEEISDIYAEYIAVPKRDTTPLLNNNTSSVPKPDNNNTRLNIDRSIKGEQFEKLFEKILDYNTERGILHLYKLRSNITSENLNIVTDNTRPILSVSLPINGTIMESEEFGVLRLNVTGSAEDADSNIKKVEVSIDGSHFELANPRAPDDWSTWSASDIVTEGTKRIMVRATDNADKRVWVPVFITIK